MRITKKFAGSDATGKQIYHQNLDASEARIKRTAREISELESIFLNKLRLLQSLKDAKTKENASRKRKAHNKKHHGHKKRSTSTYRQAQDRREREYEQAISNSIGSSIISVLPPNTAKLDHSAVRSQPKMTAQQSALPRSLAISTNGNVPTKFQQNIDAAGLIMHFTKN
jgi:hypothetical protein